MTFNCRPLFFLCCYLFTFSSWATLKERWVLEKDREGTFKSFASVSEQQELSKMQFVFITGYLAEAIEVVSSYFKDNCTILEKEFQSTCTVLTPSSHQSIESNSSKIFTSINETFKKNRNRPVVLIGHSKGGAEALLTILQHPELIKSGIVEKVILIQGAVGGSPVSDTLSSEPTNITNYLTGLNSLGTDAADKLFLEHIALLKEKVSPKEFKTIQEKIYYVRGYKNFKDTTPILLATHKLLGKNGEKNDGLLLLEDQLLPSFGTDLGILYADHSDLTVTSPLSTESAPFRYAFTRALVREVLIQK